MKFRRAVQRYGRTPEPETPYQRAGQVWDERIGSARVQARNWRLIAFGGLLLSTGLSGGLLWQSMQSRVLPYLLEVATPSQPSPRPLPLHRNSSGHRAAPGLGPRPAQDPAGPLRRCNRLVARARCAAGNARCGSASFAAALSATRLSTRSRPRSTQRATTLPYRE